ncbi:MAG: hypothetical protein AB7T07_15270 [Steroidobacteraceae bacterium]
MNFPLRRALIAGVMCVPVLTIPAAHSEPLTQYVDDFFYKLNGGRAIPRGAAGYVTYRIGARFTVNPGYTCGKFNLENNISDAINNIRTQLRGLPDQIATAATGLVSSLPMYLVKNYAPDIYGILTWNLDQSIELFRFQYKTCETIEAEIANNNVGYNPYSTAMRAAVLNQWEWGADQNNSIGQTSDEIKNDPGRRGFLFVGPGRGTANNPVPIKHDLMVLAYNNRIGRIQNPLDTSAPPASQNHFPLVQIWPTPQAAADWVVAATGEIWLVVGNNAPKRSAPGIGLRPEIDQLTDQYAIALTNALTLNDFQDIDELERRVPAKLRISDKVIEAMRRLPEEKRALAIERLASDTAVAIVKNKVDLATTLFRSAIQDPDVVTSPIASVAGSIASDTRAWLREEMDEINISMNIQKMGAGATPVLILNEGAREAVRESTQGSGAYHLRPPVPGFSE